MPHLNWLILDFFTKNPYWLEIICIILCKVACFNAGDYRVLLPFIWNACHISCYGQLIGWTMFGFLCEGYMWLQHLRPYRDGACLLQWFLDSYPSSGLPLVREKSEKFKVREKSGKFKVREKSGNFRICQGNLEFSWKSGNFLKSQGNLRKFIFHKRLRWSISISKNFQLASCFSKDFILNLPFFSKICYLKHIQTWHND